MKTIEEIREEYKKELQSIAVNSDYPIIGWAGWWTDEQIDEIAKRYTSQFQRPTKEQIVKMLKAYLSINRRIYEGWLNEIADEILSLSPSPEVVSDERVDFGAIREAVADYMRSEGCSCCQDVDAHRDHKERLGVLLKVEKYDDDSGYNFAKYRSHKNASQS